MKRKLAALSLALCLGLPAATAAGEPPVETVEKLVERELPQLLELYRDIHRNPELPLQEAQTAQKIAAELTRAGFEVHTGVGGNGVAALLKNGRGKTVMLRTELDALPVKETTGAKYASAVEAVDRDGQRVPVMHACGHDVHMASIVGSARLLAELREDWSGTLMIVAQPAEEIGAGAKAMLDDGLFKKFGNPDFALAHHVDPLLAIGSVAVAPGYFTANVDSVDILIRGRSGHGAYPHQSKDPIVIASQLVLALQTIVSREVKPIEPAVVTVGSFHSGSKHNVIPAEAKLQLTVRSYSDEVHSSILAAIERTAKGIAAAAGAEPPLVSTVTGEHTPSGYNDPDLAGRARRVWRRYFTEQQISDSEPSMGGEDFALYRRRGKNTKSIFFRVGAVKPEVLARAKKSGESLPSLHSDRFLPEAEPAVETAVKAMTALALDLLSRE